MKSYFLYNLLTGSGWRRSLIFSGILLTYLLVGCGNEEPETFVRFQIEGKSYAVKEPTLVITRMPLNYYFMDLNYLPMSAVPGAMVQWRMKMESLGKLVGQDLDLNTTDPNKVAPMILLRLTEDLTLQSQQHSNIHFKIEKIEGGFIKGSFSGTDLKYVSRTKEKTGKVDITAQFRAKFIQK